MLALYRVLQNLKPDVFSTPSKSSLGATLGQYPHPTTHSSSTPKASLGVTLDRYRMACAYNVQCTVPKLYILRSLPWYLLCKNIAYTCGILTHSLTARTGSLLMF